MGENQKNPFKDLYPPLSNVIEEHKIDFESNHNNNNNEKKEINKKVLSPEFLSEISSKDCKIPNSEIINVISKFLRNSRLIAKIENEYQNDKKYTVSSLCHICASNLSYEPLKEGQVLFKIGETGDKFYFILNGRLSVLKLQEIPNTKMTYTEYLEYLEFLQGEKEDFIVSEVLKKNSKLLPLTSPEDIRKLTNVYFLNKLKFLVGTNSFDGVEGLKYFFTQNKKNFEEFDLDEERLKGLWFRKTQQFEGSESDWVNYITKKCKPNVLDSVFFDQFQFLITDNEKKDFCLYIYEPFLYFGPGDFFGDFALDSTERRRNATIRAESDAVLASLTDQDYLKMISPKRRQEKMKEISFIYDNFFFHEINSHIFEKHYFHLFSPHEFSRGYVIYKGGETPKDLILLKEGKIEITMTCSVVDLHNLLKFLFEKLITTTLYENIPTRIKQLIPKEKLVELKTYISDPELARMKTQTELFVNEMNKMRNFDLCVLNGKIVLGLEEVFLNIPYLSTAKIVTQRATILKFDIEKLKSLFTDEKLCFYPFVKVSANKIVSLIERINHLKRSCIEMALFKVKKENDENILYHSPPSSNNILNAKIEKLILPKIQMNIPITSSVETKVNKSQRSLNRSLVKSPKNNERIESNSLQSSNAKEEKAFINLRDKCISIDNLHKEILNFKTMDNSQSKVTVIQSNIYNKKKTISNNSSLMPVFTNSDQTLISNDSDPGILNLNKIQKDPISRLYANNKFSNLRLSYVPVLIDEKEQSFSQSKPKIQTTRNIENIQFIAQLKKSNKKKILHYSSSTKHIQSGNVFKKLIFQEKPEKKEEDKIKAEQLLIPQIVKDFYQSIKKHGYSSFLKFNLNNTLLKKKMNNQSKVMSNNSSSKNLNFDTINIINQKTSMNNSSYVVKEKKN